MTATDPRTARLLRPDIAAPAALVLATALWGGNFIVGRAIRGDVDPATLNFLRWCVAVAVYLPFVAPGLWRARRLVRAHAGWIVALALTGVMGFQFATYTALVTSPVANATLLLATTPLMILGSSALLGAARLGIWQVAALALSLLGIAVILGDGDPRAVLTFDLGPGDLWLLAAVGCWTTYTQLLRRAPPGLAPDVSLLASMLAGVPVLGLMAALWGSTDIPGLSGMDWAGIAYVGLGAALAAFLAWGYGVRHKGPDGAALYLNLIPVFAISLAWAILGEPVTAGQMLGAACVVAALVLGNAGRRRKT